MFNFFKKEQPDLYFADEHRCVYPHYPIMLAKDVKPLKENQEKKFNEYHFPFCPGMHDYSRLGYIIPAWSNFHIKANKAGVVAAIGSLGADAMKRSTPFKQPMPMDTRIADGAFTPQDDVPTFVYNFPGAWKIHGNGNISALVLPAFFHSNFLDDLYVYPGVVDYNKFTTVNFICSAKRKCEIEIKAGEPVLHIIPFITNKNIVASYGPSSEEQQDSNKLGKWFHESNFYRKYYMIRKKYTLSKKTS